MMGSADRGEKHGSRPQRKREDIPDVIWGGIYGTYETQAISDDTDEQEQTRVALPCDECVTDGKMWVDFNQK